MKIGELSKRSGLSIHTLRYYEKAGLIKAPERSNGNYRIYTEDDLTTLRFISCCKQCGFSLQEAAALVRIKDDKRNHVCEEAKAMTARKIQDISKQIEQLTNMLDTLKDLEEFCCGGNKSAEFCSIIATLERETTDDAA